MYRIYMYLPLHVLNGSRIGLETNLILTITLLFQLLGKSEPFQEYIYIYIYTYMYYRRPMNLFPFEGSCNDHNTYYLHEICSLSPEIHTTLLVARLRPSRHFYLLHS